MKSYLSNALTTVCLCIALAVSALLAGCATKVQPPRPKPKPVVLSDIPVYQNTRTDWVTSTNCMVYPFAGSGNHPGAHAVCTDLKTVLKENGYRVLDMETYMGVHKRHSVDKIIRLLEYVQRNQRINAKEVANDGMAVFSVEDRQAAPLSISNGRNNKHYFQVWARKIGSAPNREIAETLLHVDGFREALEPRKEPTP